MKKLLHGWSLILTLGLLTGMSACSKDDAATPATVNVGQNELVFEAFASEAQTITVEANYDWSYEVRGDVQICTVTREEGSNQLTVTPNINYDNVEHLAQIVISAGEGSNTAVKTVNVRQEANGDTYLNLLGELSGKDNPMVSIMNNPDGETTEYTIQIQTNNKLSLIVSADQSDAEQTAMPLEVTKTRAAIPNCDWITYEITPNAEDSATTDLVLTCSNNKDTENSRIIYLDIVSGAGTDNKEVHCRIGVLQYADKPTIFVNATDGNTLIASYDQSEPLTFTVAANVDFTWRWLGAGKPYWVTSFKEISKTETNGQYEASYSIEVESWTGLEDRVETLLQFEETPLEEDGAATDLLIRQTAAPKAELAVSTTQVVFNVGEESSSKLVTVTNSFSTLDITTRDSESGESADWLEVTYNAPLLEIKVDGSCEKMRSAEVTLRCGGSGNEDVARLTVTQMGTEPTLMIDPEVVQLSAQGTPVVVNVYTNQGAWELTNPTANEAFTLEPNTKENTITVSGEYINEGSITQEYTITAGTLEKTFTVTQRMVYKVGDPFLSPDGETVGIVYEVDEEGLSGKAFSLTVNNINSLMTHTDNKFTNTPPTNRDSGLENRTTIEQEPDWTTKCQVANWTAELAKRDGVDWYVPAINELIGLVEYMSGVKFTQTEISYYGFMLNDNYPQNVEATEKNWNLIRDLYETYTNKEQYIVFWAYREYDDDGNWVGAGTPVDGRQRSTGDLPEQAGDENSGIWLSSTIELMNSGNDQVAKTVYFNPENGYVAESYLTLGNSNPQLSPYWGEFGGSIHPICQFGPKK